MQPAGGATSKNPATAGNVKGTLVIARMKYLRAQGQEAAERVLRRLSQADQQILRGMLLPSTWYAADLLMRFELTIAAVLAQGDRKALFVDMGHFTADTNLGPGGTQRPYLREGDPHFLLRNVPRMYASQHSGGTRTYEQTGAKSAVVRTIEAGGEVKADDCLTAVGWLRRAIELSGGKSVTVDETRCRANGAPCCEYVCNWV
ncbi:MAG TPA: 4-vinyl reductase [Anaeromyxobacter sp.]